MSADNPSLKERSRSDEEARNAGPESEAEDGRPSVLGEILARLEVIDRRLEERKCPAAGPSRAAFDKLAKATGAIGENIEKTRKLVGELVETDPDYKAAVDAAVGLAGKLDSCRGDFGRWVGEDRRRRRRWTVLAAAAAVPAALLLGVLIEQQFQVIPLHDPTGGWRGYVWDNYGRAIVDCAVEARGTDAEVSCPLVVRKP